MMDVRCGFTSRITGAINYYTELGPDCENNDETREEVAHF